MAKSREFPFEKKINRLKADNQIEAILENYQTPGRTRQKKIYQGEIKVNEGDERIEIRLEYISGHPIFLRAKTQEELNQAYKYILTAKLPPVDGFLR